MRIQGVIFIQQHTRNFQFAGQNDICFLYGLELLSASCGFDSRWEHSRKLQAMQKQGQCGLCEFTRKQAVLFLFLQGASPRPKKRSFRGWHGLQRRMQGDACDEEDRRSSNSKVSCTAQYYRAPARDQESGAFEVGHGLQLDLLNLEIKLEIGNQVKIRYNNSPYLIVRLLLL